MQVLLRPIARKYLERLNEPNKGRIKDSLKDLEREPPEGNIRPITGQAGYFRVKTGGYRILFRYEGDTIFVTNIDPRGQAYKKKNRGKR